MGNLMTMIVTMALGIWSTMNVKFLTIIGAVFISSQLLNHQVKKEPKSRSLIRTSTSILKGSQEAELTCEAAGEATRSSVSGKQHENQSWAGKGGSRQHCRLTICMELVELTIVSDSKIQICILILRRSALSRGILFPAPPCP